eukprot:CAMPEP_0171909944 /NCGR_PEP_ID=MMETSP0993-20121228/9055_1 /TAXON_ID=483369 /ORGANISM="non described non described, Strain CCMP2098" /LENGTH=82 /DNA_ID=CAMNT_0012543001 /DNA_START=40 /DNA_END=284 /DNA_ORIENTATION=+
MMALNLPKLLCALSWWSSTVEAQESSQLVPSVLDVDLKGFDEGFSSGDYGYLVPHSDNEYSGKVARFDMATFSNVQVLDLAL